MLISKHTNTVYFIAVRHIYCVRKDVIVRNKFCYILVLLSKEEVRSTVREMTAVVGEMYVVILVGLSEVELVRI